MASYLKQVLEAVESSKEMIDSNATTFDDMAMATNAPGGFSDKEVTDIENLNNDGNMSRSDNDPASTVACQACEENPLAKATTEITNELDNLVNISEPEEPTTSIEVIKTVGEKEPEEDDDETKDVLKSLFGESTFAKMVQKQLNNKSCEEFLKESYYAGPRDFVPDTRINASDVLRTLKAKLGDDALGIHVEQGVEPKTENNYYVVTQVDREKLPKKITVENVILELDDSGAYHIDSLSKDFPLKK